MKWERKAIEAGYIHYSFPYYHYRKIYKNGFICHKFSKATDEDSLYQVGIAPNGSVIVVTYEEYSLLHDVSKWLPISIQTLDPDAPLTSELGEKWSKQ